MSTKYQNSSDLAIADFVNGDKRILSLPIGIEQRHANRKNCNPLANRQKRAFAAGYVGAP